MKINYELDENNRVVQWRNYPLDESLPTLEIEDPYSIKLGVDKIIDGQLIIDEEKRVALKRKQEAEVEIIQLKKQLADTDYQAIKFAEGELSAEEYAPWKQLRKTWRERVNDLLKILSE